MRESETLSAFSESQITKNGKRKKQKKGGKGSVLVVLAQNLFYNWCRFYTNTSSEISIEKYCETCAKTRSLISYNDTKEKNCKIFICHNIKNPNYI